MLYEALTGSQRVLPCSVLPELEGAIRLYDGAIRLSEAL